MGTSPLTHMLTIISLNAFGMPFSGAKIIKSFLRTKIRKRFTSLGKHLNKSNADVITLQEVYTMPHLNILKKQLTNYPHCLYKSLIYGPRGGVVTFSRLPMESIEYSDFKSKGNWYNKSFVGKLSKRGLLITKIKDSSIYIANTHLTQNSDHNFKSSNRFIKMLKSQLDDVISVISLLRVSNTVILAGDFNLPKNIPLYSEFIKKAEVLDVFGKVQKPTKHAEHIAKGDYLDCIDYIFITDNLKLKSVTSSQILTEKFEISPLNLSYLSDHIGLKSEIEFEVTQKLSGIN